MMAIHPAWVFQAILSTDTRANTDVTQPQTWHLPLASATTSDLIRTLCQMAMKLHTPQLT